MGKLITIGGVSRAGKTELAEFLSSQLSNTNVLHQDEFVKAENNIPKIQGRIDWEHPDSINWEQWRTAVKKSTSIYNYTILDGLFALYDPEIDKHANLKIYLSLDKDKFLRLKHEDQRWGEEPDWFVEHIWASHFVYGTPLNDNLLIRVHDIKESNYLTLLQEIKNL